MRFLNSLKKFPRMLVWFLVLYVMLLAVVYLFQRAIVLHPVPLVADYSFQLEHPFEEQYIPADDGHCIHTLYFKTTKARKGVVLYLHGNADNLQRWAQHHNDFTNRGYDFFIFDYRGFGKSTGKSTEQNMVADAHTAYNWLRKEFPADSIIIYGRSLGTGVATALARSVPARLLVLETPFDSIKGAFQSRAPGLYLPFPLQFQFNNAANLHHIPYPVYIFHGTADKTVPFRSAIKLRPCLKEGDAFHIIEGGGHKGLCDFSIYQEQLDKILN